MMRMRLGHESTTRTHFKKKRIDDGPILCHERYRPPSPPGLGEAKRFRASDFVGPHLGVEILAHRERRFLYDWAIVSYYYCY